MKMEFSGIKVVVFDFDGVIADSMPVKNEAFRDMFTEYKEHADGIAKYLMGNQAATRYEKFTRIYEMLGIPMTEGIMEELDRDFTERTIEKIIERGPTRGAVDFFESRRDLSIYVVSNVPPEGLKKIIRGMGIGKYFKGVYCLPAAKAENIRKIIETEGVRKEEVLYTGDTFRDKEVAENVGVNFIGFVIDPERNPFPENIPVAFGFREFGNML